MSMEISRAGMDAAQTQMFQSAQRIARGNPERPGLTENITAEALNQSMAKNGFELNARMIKAQDEMTGVLLDLFA